MGISVFRAGRQTNAGVPIVLVREIGFDTEFTESNNTLSMTNHEAMIRRIAAVKAFSHPSARGILGAVLAALIALGTAGLVNAAVAPFPKPSIYPISWELKFTHGIPQRIVVNVPGKAEPQAYWYLPYTVENDGKQEQMFLPDFQMLLEDGRVIRSDDNIPPAVFDAIKKRQNDPLLESSLQIAGIIRVGEDEAKDGVAIWREPTPRLGHFTIFVQGLSGEATTVQGPHGKPIILRKTLELNYIFRGDQFYPGESKVEQNAQRWIMR